MSDVLHPGHDSKVKESLRIGEVAARAGVRVDTVRFYEREGLVCAARGRSGYRQFAPEVVGRIGFIKQAQSIGFRLDEVRDILRALDQGDPSYERGAQRLRVVAERVDTQIAELQAIRSQLSVMLDRFEAGHCAAMEQSARAMRAP